MSDVDWYLVKEKVDDSAVDVMRDVFIKLEISAFNDLVKLSGKADALSAVKKYVRIKSKYVVDEAKKALNLQGNGLDTVFLTYVFGNASVCHPDNIDAFFKEKGAEGISRHCIYKDATPEFCMSISHYYSEGVIEIINDDYQCIWTHHQTSGDDYCRYVFKKKSDPSSVVDNLGKTLVEVPKFQMPMEQWKAMNLWVCGGTWDNYTRAFVDLHGVDKTREILGTNARNLGREYGLRMADLDPELQKNTQIMGKFVRTLQNAFGQKSNFSIISKDEVSNEITDCSLQIYSPEICRQLESFFQGMVNAINPEYNISYDELRTDGGQRCHWVLKRQSSSKSQSPLEVLKMRFASGEISKEEYKEMKALLES